MLSYVEDSYPLHPGSWFCSNIRTAKQIESNLAKKVVLWGWKRTEGDFSLKMEGIY